MTAFGLKFGEPFTVPECPIVERKYAGGGKYEEYAKKYEIQNMCFQRSLTYSSDKKRVFQKPLPPLASNGNVGLVLPAKLRPVYIYDQFDLATTIIAYIVDGNFAGVDFQTYGDTAANASLMTDLIPDLTDKYGKPTKVAPQELQNAFGARYTTYNYEWRLSGLSVIYTGHIGMILGNSRGAVSITTDTLERQRREIDKKLKEERKKSKISL